MAELEFNYFPISGRGEVAKLCAAVGGVAMKCNVIMPGKHMDFGPSLTPPLPVTVPIITKGDWSMCQSLAIESYICNLSEKFSGLTPEQKLLDDMFSAIKEDIQQAIPKFLFPISCPISDDAKAKAKEGLAPILEKQFKLLEDRVPADGFVHGLDTPTKADLAVLTVVKGFTPYAWGIWAAEFPIETKAPKVLALAERVLTHPAVQEYVKSEACMLKGNVFGADGLSSVWP